MNRSLSIAAAALLIALVPAGAARADDFYVADDAHGACSQPSPCNLSAAIALSDLTPATADTIHVDGPLDWLGTVDLSHSPIDLEGSGQNDGGTHLTGDVIRVGNGSTLAHVRVNPTGAAGIELFGAATLRDADVRTLFNAVAATPAVSASPVIENSSISVVPHYERYSSGVTALGTRTDPSVVVRGTTITAETGINAGNTPVTVQRSRIVADSGLALSDGWSWVEDSVIKTTSAGIVAEPHGNVWVLGSTIVSVGSGAGIETTSSGVPTLVEDSIVRGYKPDLRNYGPDGTLVARGSDYVTSSGTITDGGGNLSADPQFADPAHGDYRLTAGSPLIDAGVDNHIDKLGDTDITGAARVADGNGDGTALVDLGAYEYFPSSKPIDTHTLPPQDPQPPAGQDPQPPVGQDPQPPTDQPGDQAPQPPTGQTPPPAGPRRPAPKPLSLALAGSRLVVEGNAVAFSVRCTAACSVRATLSGKGRTLGSVRGAGGPLRIRLSRSALAFIAKRHVHRVTLSVVSGAATATRSYRLVA
jgi:hypothetical protein